jgi:hypothetical protein
MTAIDHIASFANRVSSVIHEDDAFVQHSKYQETLPVPVFDDFNEVLSSVNNPTTQNPPRPSILAPLIEPLPQAFLKEEKDWVTGPSFSTLFLVYIDPLVTLRSKAEVCTRVEKFRTDLADKLAGVYKSYGFSRKRKITLQSMQDNIKADKVDEYIFTYMAKVLNKNIWIQHDRKKQEYVCNDTCTTWLYFAVSDGESGIRMYMNELHSQEECKSLLSKK